MFQAVSCQRCQASHVSLVTRARQDVPLRCTAGHLPLFLPGSDTDMWQHLLKVVDLRPPLSITMSPRPLSSLPSACLDAVPLWRDEADPHMPRASAGRV